MFDIAPFAAKLKAFDALRDNDEIKTGIVECIQPHLANKWPAQLAPSDHDALIQRGIPCPSQHQANAISKALDGMDVVLASPTASGKTLAFTTPMLHTLGSTMRAWAFDQREQIRPFCQPLSVESWPYDGDTPKDIRDALRP